MAIYKIKIGNTEHEVKTALNDILTPGLDSSGDLAGGDGRNSIQIVGYNADPSAANLGDNITDASCTATFGDSNTNYGTSSVVTGSCNTNGGSFSLMAGTWNVNDGGNNTFMIGYDNSNTGDNGIIAGYRHTNNGDWNLIAGYNHQISASGVGAVGTNHTINTPSSFATGHKNKILNTSGSSTGNNFAAGIENTIDAEYASALGYFNKVYGNGSGAIGSNNEVHSPSSLAAGNKNKILASTTNGTYGGNFVVGNENTLDARNCLATGVNNFIYTQGGFINGRENQTMSNGRYSINSGQGNYVNHWNTLTSGLGLHSIREGGAIVGTYNAFQGDPDIADALFIVGNGLADNARSNAFMVTNLGDTITAGTATICGNLSVMGTINGEVSAASSVKNDNGAVNITSAQGLAITLNYMHSGFNGVSIVNDEYSYNQLELGFDLDYGYLESPHQPLVLRGNDSACIELNQFSMGGQQSTRVINFSVNGNTMQLDDAGDLHVPYFIHEHGEKLEDKYASKTDMSHVDSLLSQMLLAIQTGGTTADTINRLEEMLVTYLEAKTVQEVEG